jgi:prophage regulatory protein
MRVLSYPELKAKGVRYSKPHLHRMIKAGTFPKPINLGPNAVAFIEEEVDAWLKSKRDERDRLLAAPPTKLPIRRAYPRGTK